MDASWRCLFHTKSAYNRRRMEPQSGVEFVVGRGQCLRVIDPYGEQVSRPHRIRQRRAFGVAVVWPDHRPQRHDLLDGWTRALFEPPSRDVYHRRGYGRPAQLSVHPCSQDNPLSETTDPERPTELPAGDYDVAVFQNLFPAFTPLAHDPPALSIPTREGRGDCEVVVFTRDPAASLGSLPLWHIEMVLDVWADRYRDLASRDGSVRVPV